MESRSRKVDFNHLYNFFTMEEGGSGNVCKCSHHKFFSGLVVLFGLLFLAGALDLVSGQIVDIGWPIVVVAAGFMKMMEGKCKCC